MVVCRDFFGEKLQSRPLKRHDAGIKVCKPHMQGGRVMRYVDSYLVQM